MILEYLRQLQNMKEVILEKEVELKNSNMIINRLKVALTEISLSANSGER